jgi:mono/diheme cytochrome c family protein
MTAIRTSSFSRRAAHATLKAVRSVTAFILGAIMRNVALTFPTLFAAASFVCYGDSACTSYNPPPAVSTPGKPSTQASRGSAIALSDDDSVLLVANRDSGTVSVFSVDYTGDGTSANLTKKSELQVGAEPWQLVIASDNETAYVVLRKDQKLVKISGLKTEAKVAASVDVGSEPTAIALSPTGAHAYVANWADGTVQDVGTGTMVVGKTIDLNAALAQSGLLGAGVKSRPGLAHPRSIAVTNNLDANDDDESLYVTEYYAQQVEKDAADGNNADRTRAGIVYKVAATGGDAKLIRLAPIADMGFKDSADGVAGCYPNQLQSITVEGPFAYVTSICASPKGPIGVVATATPPNVANVRTTTHGAVSVIDLRKDAEVAPTSLHARFDAMFQEKAIPDDASRRYPLVPMDLAFVPGKGVAYVPANGTDAVFRVVFNAETAAVQEVGSTTQPFINVNPAGIAASAQGKNPIGMAIRHNGNPFGFIANDVTRNVTVVDFKTQAVLGGTEAPKVAQSSALPEPGSQAERDLKGKRFFNTGVGRWSLKGQGWGACQVCHMDGLSDNVTWYFARGPRQSTSLDGSFNKKDPNDQRIFNWTAIFDEVADFELNTRGVSGGVGATVSVADPVQPAAAADRIDIQGLGHSGLSGSSLDAADPANPLGLAPGGKLADWNEITGFVARIRSPRGLRNLDAALVAKGRTLFTAEGSCQGCHGGDKWTMSTRFYKPSVATTAALKAAVWTAPVGFPAGLLPAEAGARFMRSDNGNPAAFDSIQCILRPVGTFGVADGFVGVAELRQDMKTPAQGNEATAKGYNPPSLLGLSVGAPYLHSGGAATLESLFSDTFKAHHGALAPNFLTESDAAARANNVAALVQFLLSIDGSTPVEATPRPGGQGGNFCAAP